jgi:hypothetical protein
LSAGSGEKFVEKARRGSSPAIHGWSAFCATLMSLTLVMVLDRGVVGY